MKSLIISLISLVSVLSVSAESLVEGRVRLDSGEPVAEAQVHIFDMTDLQRGPIARAQTDGTGYFALPLAALRGNALPEGFALGPNYPNPFNPSTIIPYQLAVSSQVRLEVFNLLGQHIATLVDGQQSAGFHTATWYATDAAGRAVGAGVYIYRMTVGAANQTQTGRMVLIDGQAGVSAVGMASVLPNASGGGPFPVYGLVVSGSGLAPYIDRAFRVEAGMAPVDLVVEAHPAGKALGDDDSLFDLADLFNTSAEEAPDLIVSSASVSDTTLTPGQAFTLNAKVRNQGAEPSAATTLRYYRSTDATITSDDEEVGTDAIVALNPSAINGVLISLTAPTSAGTYYYGACVESVADESESDNNCSRAVRITVSSGDGEDGHTTPAGDLFDAFGEIADDTPIDNSKDSLDTPDSLLFNIELLFTDNVHEFDEKELEWMAQITHQWEHFFYDIDDFVFEQRTPVKIHNTHSVVFEKERVIDDLLIFVDVLTVETNGTTTRPFGETNGNARVNLFRSDGDVPLVATILMNREKMYSDSQENLWEGAKQHHRDAFYKRVFIGTFHHELGHAFGIGPSPAWTRNVYWPDNFSAWFRGENAYREYRLMAPDANEYLGISDNYEGIPLLTQSLQKPRTAAHWYLLSPLKWGFFWSYWSRDNDLPNISRTSLGAFEDIGWNVNYEKGLTSLGPWWNDPNVGWPICQDGTFHLCPENMRDPEKERIVREIMSQ